ncbi:hypothetical protein [Lederbergia lenta]|uniref:YhjD n=1 Tax=Lederbergia lenta TaxID=1467 RepID=A0A2X4WTK5_LEDLE|nr:hypothetical protein [Lederbergia lenta]MCM3110486.1 hypothetical protein [Lederbergia lenta]MEC2323948.1 hypothetical protein [Lederbergia lenta]SQI60970.1 YhjD [Lederbergia lenta]
MSRIPTYDYDLMEQAIYLPMLLTVLKRDLFAVEKGSFKFKRPYSELIQETMAVIQNDLAKIKRYLYKNNIQVERLKSDEAFTMYIFLYKGHEEHHNYFNPKLRNGVEELMQYYLLKQFKLEQKEKEA